MTTEEKIWELRFNCLNEKYMEFKIAYADLKEEYVDQIHQIDKLQKENSSLKQKIEELTKIIERFQKFEIRRSSNNESLNEFAKALCSKWPRVLNSLSLFLPHNGLYERNQEDYLSTAYPSETQTTGKTPQANPDQSLGYDNLDLRLFESFYLLGISNNNIGKPDSTAEILYEFIDPNTENPNKKILTDFCFPTELQCRPVRYSVSEEEINNILFGQEQELRASSCYVFILRSNENNDGIIEFADLPNADRELIYCICVQVEDIGIDPIKDSEWIHTKCLCLMTFIPCFELHFRFLRALMQLQKLWRMQTLTGQESIRASLRRNIEEVPPTWKELLSKYMVFDDIGPGSYVCIEDPLIPPIEYTFNEDLSMIDITWVLSSLISRLEAQDFLWLVAALVQEKSIVFVSYNMDLLTTCTLALHALLRPFKWPYLFMPLIPDSLRELLEAPVPILAGLPGSAPDMRKTMPHLVWVHLDEPNPKKRILWSSTIYQEVQELPNSLLKQDLITRYNSENQEVNISSLIKQIWKKILDVFKGRIFNDTDSLQRVVVDEFSSSEQGFMMNLIQTQMFINSIEDNIR